jgi:hypothetical protein
MSGPDLPGRIAARNKARIDQLAIDIIERGIDAAIEFSRASIEGEGEVGKASKRSAGLALLELQPDNPAIWSNHELNVLLREHGAQLIANGEPLTPALRVFAARALTVPPPPKRKGRPSNQWTQVLAIAALRDLAEAGVPVYHNGSTDAAFFAVDAVAAAIGIKERSLRDWWQDRKRIFGDI